MLKTAICFVTFLTCINVDGFAQETFQYEKQIDALVQPYLENDKLMAVSIDVIKDGKSWSGNWGQLSETDKSKPTSETVYEIA